MPTGKGRPAGTAEGIIAVNFVVVSWDYRRLTLGDIHGRT